MGIVFAPDKLKFIPEGPEFELKVEGAIFYALETLLPPVKLFETGPEGARLPPKDPKLLTFPKLELLL